MSTEPVVKKNTKKVTKKVTRKRATKKSAREVVMEYGAIQVVHVDTAKNRVYLGTNPETSTSRLEELQSEDAKQLAVKAANAAGVRDAMVQSTPSLVNFCHHRKVPCAPNDVYNGDKPELCLEVEVTTFGGDAGFVGDSIDVVSPNPLG